MLDGGGNIRGKKAFPRGGAVPGVQRNLPAPRAVAIVLCENGAGLRDGASPRPPAPPGQ